MDDFEIHEQKTGTDRQVGILISIISRILKPKPGVIPENKDLEREVIGGSGPDSEIPFFIIQIRNKVEISAKMMFVTEPKGSEQGKRKIIILRILEFGIGMRF
jgi:hypothetical protein